jgi:hypothetical protein
VAKTSPEKTESAGLFLAGREPRCKRDGFPMVEIDGKLECAAEYIDRCIGQQPVVDIIQRGKTTYYVFANGHQVPMLCSCCGTPLVYRELEQPRREIVGRRLDAMSIQVEVLADGRKYEELVLEFLGATDSEPFGVPVSFLVAAQMKHPGHCPHRPNAVPVQPADRKKRRYRGLPGRN